MRIQRMLVLAALAASALLALAVGGASARSFSVNERNFELIWNNAFGGNYTKLTFGEPGTKKVECNVTLLGGYSSNTIAKSTSINQGTIRHGEAEGCIGGSATIRTETMPWNLRYRSFTGRLPAIETIATNLIGASWRVQESGGLSCTSTTEVAEPAVGVIQGAGLEDIRAERTPTIRLESLICQFASPGHFEGLGLIRNLPRTAKITVTLI